MNPSSRLPPPVLPPSPYFHPAGATLGARQRKPAGTRFAPSVLARLKRGTPRLRRRSSRARREARARLITARNCGDRALTRAEQRRIGRTRGKWNDRWMQARCAEGTRQGTRGLGDGTGAGGGGGGGGRRWRKRRKGGDKFRWRGRKNDERRTAVCAVCEVGARPIFPPPSPPPPVG